MKKVTNYVYNVQDGISSSSMVVSPSVPEDITGKIVVKDEQVNFELGDGNNFQDYLQTEIDDPFKG